MTPAAQSSVNDIKFWNVLWPLFPSAPSCPSSPLSPWAPLAPLAPGFPALPWEVETVSDEGEQRITESLQTRLYQDEVQKNHHGGRSGELYLLTRLPGDPSAPGAPGGPMSVRLLMGQPWEHLARMEEAYWDIWAVITPLQSCRTCSSVRPGPCRTEIDLLKNLFILQ